MHSRSRPIPALLLAAALLSACGSGGGEADFPRLSGPYLGQTPPGSEPEVFAPGIVSNGLMNRDIAISPDGSEIYFGIILGSYTASAIAVSRQVDGVWTEPELLPFADDPRYMHIEPALSPDGLRLFFATNRPHRGSGEPRSDTDIWMSERTAEGWSDPGPLGPTINTHVGEFFPSLTREGTLYFTRSGSEGPGTEFIYRARREGEAYGEPERLPEEVNADRAQYNAFIDPDERFIIVPRPGREDGLGGTDYYVSFREEDEGWVGPILMGEPISSEASQEWSPYVSPDGRYLFFMSNRLIPDQERTDLTWRGMVRRHTRPGNGLADMWWVDASFIMELRP